MQKLDIKFPIVTADDDIIIWEGHAQTPALRPVSSGNTKEASTGSNWELSDSIVLFQGYVEGTWVSNFEFYQNFAEQVLSHEQICTIPGRKQYLGDTYHVASSLG